MLPSTRMLPFFVYGTLRRNQGNHRLLADALNACERAEVDDVQLHDAGAFPYATPAPGSRVVGDLIDVDAPRYTDVLASLDRLEGFYPDDHASSHYVRVECTVRVVADGRRQVAWIYIAGPLVDLGRYPRHATGDWTASTLTAYRWQRHPGRGR